MSSAYHHQIVNRCLEGYLRFICNESPKDWAAWFPLVKWWFNTHYHSAIQITSFQTVYNQVPPLQLPYLPRECVVAAIDRSMQRRESMINLLNNIC